MPRAAIAVPALQTLPQTERENSPGWPTMLRSLAKKKPHLLQRLRKGIFARHYCFCVGAAA